METDSKYYYPYFPSDSEEEEASSDYESQGSFDRPDTLPRPENAAADEVDPRLEGPDFAALAQALILPTTGPTFSTDDDQLAFSHTLLDKRKTYGPWATDLSGNSWEKQTRPTKNVETVVMLQSIDRDKSIYPLPTACQLFLPRDYRNVTSFSIVQLNLICSFFYFSATKQNLSIQIAEKLRTLYSPNATSPSTIGALTPTISIRQGTYNITDLLRELQLQLNNPPLFYDFIGGFNDFYKIFVVNGDFSLNFNFPGDSYYDSLHKTYIINPTRGQIVANYFSSQFGNRFNYTTAQTKIAYYYPVLKECILDTQTDLTTLNLMYPGMTADEVVQYLIYTFSGIDDAIALAVISANTALLDVYRVQHTFRYSLINQYNCSYDTANNKVTIQSSSLNTSLVNLLNNQNSIYLTQQLGINGITRDYYNTILATNNNLLSVVQAMYDTIQRALASNFAVDVGTYDRTYFLTLSNTVLLRDGTNAAGVDTNYNPNSTPISNDLTNAFRSPPVPYWTGMRGLGQIERTPRNMGSYMDPFPTSSNYPYSLVNSNINFNTNFVDSNGVVYTDTRRKCGDILVDVAASKYTIFQFRSKVRQTLQIQTLPRQTPFRYPAYTAAQYASTYPLTILYSASTLYTYQDASTALSSIVYPVILTPIVGWSTITDTFGIDYPTSLAYWGSSYDTITAGNSNGLFYRYKTPFAQPPELSTVNKYPLNLTIQSPQPAGFEGSMTAFVYHDIAALNADISQSSNESPYFYKYTASIPAGVSSFTISTTPSGRQIQSYENQEYFVILRHSDHSQPATTVQVVPWFPAGTAISTLTTDLNFDPFADPSTQLSNFNVAKNADPDWIRLPIYSTLYANPYSSSLLTQGSGYASKASPYDAAITAQARTVPPALGYDISGVSNNLTDYILFPAPQSSFFAGNTRYALDPFNNYVFKYVAPFNGDSQSYEIGPAASNNSVYTPNVAAVYSIKSIPTTVYSITQYYDTVYIADLSSITQQQQQQQQPNTKPYSSTILTNGPISGYNYDICGNLSLDGGVCGFTFAPSNGTWAVDSITFKTNHLTQANPNSNIAYLGIFVTSAISEVALSGVHLSNAIAKFAPDLSRTITITPATTSMGFSNYGTYYTFSSINATPDIPFYGYAQTTQQLITDTNSYYSVLAFDSAGAITQIQNLTGSPNAYPMYYKASTLTQFYDGQPSPTGQGMVVSDRVPMQGADPLYGPQGDADFSVNQYQQSMPFVNSHLHYTTSVVDIIYNATAFQPWTTLTRFGGPYTIQPMALYTSVPGFMMMQTGVFSILTYPKTTPATAFTFKTTLTPDQVFPAQMNTTVVAVSGTSTSYCFLGVTTGGGSYAAGQLMVRYYNPATMALSSAGVLSIPPVPTQLTVFDISSLEIQHFICDDEKNWFFTALEKPNAANNYTASIIFQGYIASNGLQVWHRYAGTYSELQMDPASTNVYLAVSASADVGYSKLYQFTTTYSPTAPNYIANIATNPTGNTWILQGYNDGPAKYTQFAVSKVTAGDQVMLVSANPLVSHYFFTIESIKPRVGSPNVYETRILQSAQRLATPPLRLYGGGGGSSWLQNAASPYILGNRNTSVDSAVSIATAWQIFFPTLKIQMRKLSSALSPMTDLTGLNWPEWPHTAVFSYSSYSSLCADISNNVQGGKWGMESSGNYMTCDVSFSGFYFNSYVQSIPLLPNHTNPSYETDYYVTFRGYVPTESFQTLVRFSLPNLYDFGYVRLRDMVTEISSINGGAIQRSNCTPAYYDNISSFNNTFILKNYTIGSNSIQSFPGSTITTTGFGDFLATYRDFYITYSTNTVVLESIQSNVTASMNSFILRDMQYILPSTFLTRQRYTDPLVFSILWKSQLQNTFMTLEDDWGLGWNLGYQKVDTPYSTVATASNIFKIQQDFIYLQLNSEFNINRMDTGTKEVYATSREGSGNINQYYCKLLLTDFGGNANTFFHNPVSFNPPLGKLSRLSFQWLDSKGAVLSNVDANWNMVINITENVGEQSFQ